MDKALPVIEEMILLSIIRAYAIGGGIAAKRYIARVPTCDLDSERLPPGKIS